MKNLLLDSLTNKLSSIEVTAALLDYEIIWDHHSEFSESLHYMDFFDASSKSKFRISFHFVDKKISLTHDKQQHEIAFNASTTEENVNDFFYEIEKVLVS